VAFLPDGSRAYVPAEGESAVTVIDAKEDRIVQTITIPGDDVLPMCAITDPAGDLVFVSTGRGNSVAIIDPTSNRVTATIPVGKRPWGIALSPDGRTLFAANGKSDNVSVVDVAAGKELRRIAVGKGPWGVAVGR
jgi:YVTN family beta-propeller protein